MQGNDQQRRPRVLELFCGIGGCAAAVADGADVVAAVDISQPALLTYRHNFRHPTLCASVESIPVSQFRRWDADLWWLSPPCQPFTARGAQRDLDDPRALPLLVMFERIAEVQPPCLALENVPGFVGSQAHQRLRRTLAACGYEVDERLLCPTDLGVPGRRRRFYLTACRGDLAAPVDGEPLAGSAAAPPRPGRQAVAGWRFAVAEILEPEPAGELWVSPDFASGYASALHVVDGDEPGAVCSCFTSAYGQAYVRSGPYLKTPQGLRRFSPREILRLLGFPDSFELPVGLTPRQAWKLVGNSLSIFAVRDVLGRVVPLSDVGNDRARAPGYNPPSLRDCRITAKRNSQPFRSNP